MGITFYRSILRKCILHFLNQQKILRFFIPIMGGLEKIFFLPLLCAAVHFRARMQTPAVNQKQFFCVFVCFT
jgi:hypothetical protein